MTRRELNFNIEITKVKYEIQSLLAKVEKIEYLANSSNEEKYHIGQQFICLLTNEVYLLAQVGDNRKVNLINIRNGNRKNQSINVSDPRAITKKEFEKLWDLNLSSYKLKN